MKVHLVAKFDVEKWDESPFDDRIDVPKVTRALVIKRYSGDIEGSSTTEWLMAYGEDGSARFVGLERISGSVTGREGSLVLQHVGSYEGGVAKGDLEVLQGGCSGALQSRGATVNFWQIPVDQSGCV